MITNESRRKLQAQSTRVAVFTAALAVGVGLLLASPAQAKDEFERAFKHELGRIAAHEAVHAGRHVLAGTPLGLHYGFPRQVHYRHGRFQGTSHHYGHDRVRVSHWRFRHGYDRHYRRHRHHDGCSHDDSRRH